MAPAAETIEALTEASRTGYLIDDLEYYMEACSIYHVTTSERESLETTIEMLRLRYATYTSLIEGATK